MRPDAAEAIAEREALIPFNMPTVCEVTEWAGPEDRRGAFEAHYWLDSDGFTIDSDTSVLWDGEDNWVGWSAIDGDDLQITGELIGNPSTTLIVTTVQRVERSTLVSPHAWRVVLRFPESGCWRLQAEAGTRSAKFIVYVFPIECKPHLVTGERSSACTEPTR